MLGICECGGFCVAFQLFLKTFWCLQLASLAQVDPSPGPHTPRASKKRLLLSFSCPHQGFASSSSSLPGRRLPSRTRPVCHSTPQTPAAQQLWAGTRRGYEEAQEEQSSLAEDPSTELLNLHAGTPSGPHLAPGSSENGAAPCRARSWGCLQHSRAGGTGPTNSLRHGDKAGAGCPAKKRETELQGPPAT